jgi:hypothetical protein
VLVSLFLTLWCASLYGVNRFLQRTTPKPLRQTKRK